MGSKNSKSISSPGKKDPSGRIDQLMNEERQKLIDLKKKPNPDFVQTTSQKCQKIIDTLDYFQTNGGIINTKERHIQEVEQTKRQLSESQQNNKQLLQQNNNCLKNQVDLLNQLNNRRQELENANNAIKSLEVQFEAQKNDNSQKKQEQEKELKLQQDDNIKFKEQFEQRIKQRIKNDQDQIGGLKEGVKEKMNGFEQNDAYLKKLYAEQQNEKNSLQVVKQQKQKEQQKQIEQIKKNSNDQVNKSLFELENSMKQKYNSILAKKKKDFDEYKQNCKDQIIKLNQEINDLKEQKNAKGMLEDSELSKEVIEENLKKQLEELNPHQEITQSLIEFVKQFQAIQKDKFTEEQIKVIAKKHQEIEQLILKQLKEIEENPTHFVSLEEQKKNDGYQGVLLMHTMLAEEGITSYITDKPMEQIEQSPKGAYQQKIIQCGIHDSSSYFSANYDTPQEMQKQISDAQSFPNYIQKFKNDVATDLGEKDITPLNIKVFETTTSPPSIKFKIFSTSGKKIDIKSKNFKSLRINVEAQNLLDKAELSIDMFDPNYNMSWDNNMISQTDERGALQFYNQQIPTPQIYNYPFGYQGLGLKVIGRYGKDLNWIRSDTQPGTWIVLFHGTGYSNLKGIIDQNKINPGKNNVYGGSRCRITGTIIKEGECQNTYLTDIVKEAEDYSIGLKKINKVIYSFIFQCRVNPKKVKSPEYQPSYYTVENPLDDIRPYRLLIKKIVQ